MKENDFTHILRSSVLLHRIELVGVAGTGVCQHSVRISSANRRFGFADLPHSDISRFSALNNVVKSIHGFSVGALEVSSASRAADTVPTEMDEQDGRDRCLGVESMALVEINMVCAESLE